MDVNKQTPKEIKRIVIETIPHKDQRYNTCGDWFFEPASFSLANDTGTPESLVIKVSDTGNWKWNMALALHELAEAILCTEVGITADVVDKFDISWKEGYFDEPGNDPRAPYYSQHKVAQQIEETFLNALDSTSDAQVEWAEYEACLERLQKEYNNEPVDGPEEEHGL